MPMTKSEATTACKRLIDLVSRELLGGKTFNVVMKNNDRTDDNGGIIPGTIDKSKVIPEVRVVHGAFPNAVMYFDFTTEMVAGIEVTAPLLRIPDNVAIKFGLAHELGHTFSPQLLEAEGLGSLIGGAAQEVAADLGSAYLLVCDGHSWDEVVAAAANGANTGIFDSDWSGQHPPGSQRAQWVRKFRDQVTRRRSPISSLRAIVESLRGYGPPGGWRSATPPRSPTIGGRRGRSPTIGGRRTTNA